MTPKVWCLLIGHEKKPSGQFFQVNPGQDIADLKKAVKQETLHATRNADARDLLVWRCKDQSTMLRCSDFESNVETVFLNEGAEVLDEWTTMAELGVSATETLLVQNPVPISPSKSKVTSVSASTYRTNDSTDSFALLDRSTIRRDRTVDALLQRLDRYKFIMVRGTPASGKSTLAELLSRHIREKYPRMRLIKISNWTRCNEGWKSRLKRCRYNPDIPTTIIFDEAQLTYWATNLWNNFFKSITEVSNTRAILFASYGSPAGRPSVQETSMVISDFQHINLTLVAHPDHLPSVGLFLTRDEFTEIVQKRYPTERFSEDFRDYVYRATAGHVGAVGDLFRVVLSHDSYCQLRVNNGEYTLEIFRSQLPIKDLWRSLQNTGIFRRGLPALGELQRTEIARIFRTVHSKNHVTLQMLDHDDHKYLQECFERGWLHAARSDHGVHQWTEYIFATPLHQWFVEYYLGTSIPDPTPIEELTLPEFAFNVIRSFSQEQLSSPRKVGTSDMQRPSEARFQDEFYRCCLEHSKGSLVSFPDFDDAGGRADFYIPCKQWGVELLYEYDQDRLESHASRFAGSSKYADMSFSDYIILNCCKHQPQQKHPGMPKLYHVVFSDDYRNVRLLAGSSLDEIARFELLE